MDDDLDPRPQPMGPRNLDNMSVYELEEYVEDLKAEIVRVEDNMAKKKAGQDAAASFFKS